MDDAPPQRLSEYRPSLPSRARQRVRELPYVSEFLWRYLLNLASFRSFRKAPPQLNSTASRVVQQLHESGIAVATIDDLLDDPGLFEQLQKHANVLECQAAERINTARVLVDALDPPKDEKTFVVELLDRRRPVIHPSDVLGQISLDSQLRGIADTYFGLRSRVSDINLWRTLRTRRPPRSSQLWHRDIREDRYVLKMFIYLEDVDESSGPFTYLAKTHPKGVNRRMRLPGQTRESAPRALADAPDLAGYGADVVTVSGPAGTVIFADTLGFHRGGYAPGRDRLVCQVRYASRAAARHRMLGCPADIHPHDYRSDFAYDEESLTVDTQQRHGLRT